MVIRLAKCIKKGCKAHAITDDDYCFAHSQSLKIVQKRKTARKKGGSRGKLRVTDTSIDSIEDVKRILVEAINELRSCAAESTVSKARALGYLCGIALTALEKGDLEERIARLEELSAETT